MRPANAAASTSCVPSTRSRPFAVGRAVSTMSAAAANAAVQQSRQTTNSPLMQRFI